MNLKGFMELVTSSVEAANLETGELRDEDVQAMRKALPHVSTEAAKDAVSYAMRDELIKSDVGNVLRARVLAEISRAVFHQRDYDKSRRLARMSPDQVQAEYMRLQRGAMGDMRPSDHGSLTLELKAWHDQAWHMLGSLRATSGDRWPSVRRSIEEFLEDDSKKGPL